MATVRIGKPRQFQRGVVVLSIHKKKKLHMSTRFHGLLPMVVDVETSGLNPLTNSLLEVAMVMVGMDAEGRFYTKETYAYHVEPFVGANLDPEALAITGIDPDYPLRYAMTEQQVLHVLFGKVAIALKETHCQRAVLVGHNAWFDLAFLQAAIKRCKFMNSPFHSFTTIDTASLSAVALGETVLARAIKAAGISFDVKLAHSALYDAEKTAELFCWLVNRSR